MAFHTLSLLHFHSRIFSAPDTTMKFAESVFEQTSHGRCYNNGQLLQRGRAMLYVIEYFVESLKVTKGHWKWYYSKIWVRVPICIPQQLWPYLWPFRHNIRTWRTHGRTPQDGIRPRLCVASRSKNQRYSESLEHKLAEKHINKPTNK